MIAAALVTALRVVLLLGGLVCMVIGVWLGIDWLIVLGVGGVLLYVPASIIMWRLQADARNRPHE